MPVKPVRGIFDAVYNPHTDVIRIIGFDHMGRAITELVRVTRLVDNVHKYNAFYASLQAGTVTWNKASLRLRLNVPRSI
jgi:hypothetical protein